MAGPVPVTTSSFGRNRPGLGEWRCRLINGATAKSPGRVLYLYNRTVNES
ncbi:MAG: hypothetical protein JWO38_4184 [Gemmataceae bacterium]|nr:hypothetical protein [Gemmataceae bacterium]